MGVRKKLMIAMIVFTVLLGSVVIYTLYQGYELFQNLQAQQTQQRKTVVEQLLSARVKETARVAEMLAATHITKISLREKKKFDLLSMIRPIVSSTEIDFIAFYDSKESVFVQTPRNQRLTQSVSFLSWLRRLPANGTGKSIMTMIDNKLMLISAKRVYSGNENLGIVVSG